MSGGLDHETAGTLIDGVTLEDTAGLVTVGTVTIEVTDAPEPPSFPYAQAPTATVKEGAASGTTAVVLTASDPDDGDTIVYSLVSETHARAAAPSVPVCTTRCARPVTPSRSTPPPFASTWSIPPSSTTRRPTWSRSS